MEQGEIIGTKEATAIIGRTPRALEYWRHWGVGPPFVKRFGRCMYSKSECERFAERLRNMPHM